MLVAQSLWTLWTAVRKNEWCDGEAGRMQRPTINGRAQTQLIAICATSYRCISTPHQDDAA